MAKNVANISNEEVLTALESFLAEADSLVNISNVHPEAVGAIKQFLMKLNVDPLLDGAVLLNSEPPFEFHITIKPAVSE